MTLRRRILRAHPATLVLASFLLAITTGTLLLKLPFATHSGYIPLVDAAFTATSAVCVTGLIVVDTGSYFTRFGQVIVLLLLQIGGLGVMTISVALFRWVGRTISFRQRMAMQDMFAHTPRQDIFRLLKNIVLFTLVAELIGAALLTIHWTRELPFSAAAYNGIFHSVSAFCNAGFALFADSMMQYSGNLLLNITMCALIIIGGIGFPVLYDLQSWLTGPRKPRARLSIQTKAVLLTTAVLILGGALMFAMLERHALRQSSSPAEMIIVPVFQSITCRTAGFNTVDTAALTEATLAMMMFLMFFGASPGSCGGGVKTTTLALLTAFTWCRVTRHRRVNMFKKSVPTETVTRSISLTLLSMGIIGVVLFMLLVGTSFAGGDPHDRSGIFLPHMFETFSAFGTVGLSMGITPDLSTWGKCWIMLMMILGRVGVLTFSYIIIGGGAGIGGAEYSEENMMIG